MAIGGDIKEVFEDIGTAYTILRDAGNVSGEYLDFEVNRQITKPFIREFFLEAAIAYDTQSVAGDILQFDITNDKFILVNKTPEIFENAIIIHECVLYKCNVSGELSRPTTTRSNQTYHATDAFPVVKSDCNALMTEQLFGHDLDTDEELGMIGIQKHELYIPRSVDPQVLDRYEGQSGEYFMIESIKKRRFDAVYVCNMEEDTR